MPTAFKFASCLLPALFSLAILRDPAAPWILLDHDADIGCVALFTTTRKNVGRIDTRRKEVIARSKLLE